MVHIELTADASAAIAARIDAFDSEAHENSRWLSPFVHKFDVLPLFSDWTESFGIRPDGAIVRWSTEEEYEGWRSVEDGLIFRLALVSGAKRYPFLQQFVPERPAGALDCDTCRGTGTIDIFFPNIICECGGIGWVDPPD